MRTHRRDSACVYTSNNNNNNYYYYYYLLNISTKIILLVLFVFKKPILGNRQQRIQNSSPSTQNLQVTIIVLNIKIKHKKSS